MLSKDFEASLADGAKIIASAALFHRFVIDLWRRRWLGSLRLDGHNLVATLLRGIGCRCRPAKAECVL
jgi:hypothetical protein